MGKFGREENLGLTEVHKYKTQIKRKGNVISAEISKCLSLRVQLSCEGQQPCCREHRACQEVLLLHMQGVSQPPGCSLSGEEDRWMCSREGKGERSCLSASDLKEQVPFVDHAVQLGAFSWHWPAGSAFGELLVKCGRDARKEAGAELDNSPWSPRAETIGPKSPLPFEKGQDGRNLECFCVQLWLFFLLSGLSVCYPLPAPESVIKTN